MNKNAKYKKIINTKSQKGITLIVLVITIMVMLILAGATINMVLGEGGFLNQSEKAKKIQEEKIKKEDTEVDNLIEKADEERNKYTNEVKNGIIVQDGETVWDEETHTATIKLKTTEIVPAGTNILYQIDSTKGTWILYQESGIANLNHGSTVFARLYDGKNENKESGISIIDDIAPELATITNLPISANLGATITATVTHRDKQSGINLSNCKWIFNDIVNIDKEDNVWNTAQTFNTSTNQINITVPNIAKNYYLHVLSVDNAGRKRVTISTKVEVKQSTPISGTNPTNTPIQNGYGKIDIVWLDENNHVIEQPKAPILQSKANPTAEEKVKMTPVKWSGTGATATLVDSGVDETNPEIEKADGTKEKDWYDYESHRWANARTNNQSYFVWIPRYAYRITYYESKENQTSPVGYCDGYGMWRTDGTLEYKLEEGIETVEAQDGNLYIVHPAFGAKQGSTQAQKTQNINNGGWGDTLAGFWFAKFEMSGDNGATLKSSPEGNSKRSTTIGEFYTMGRTASYGQTGTVDSTATDGITVASFMNSHMVKNSEWGAVAYLTHSKFGLNGEEVAINGPSDNGTGGGTSATSYLSNQNQSTTANPYGVYDMSGGAYEYTAAFNNKDSNSYFGNTSKWTENTKLNTSSNSTKYATKYENSSGTNNGNTIYTIGKTGDATKEVYLGNNGSSGWFGDYSSFAYSGAPFFLRGGSRSYGADAGVFYSSSSYGVSSSYGSFRAALAPFSL